MSDLVYDVLIQSADPSWVTAYRGAVTPRRPNPGVDARAIARLASGRTVPFMLELTAVQQGVGMTVKVTESAPRTIPLFCPDRHIVDGGGFCLTRLPVPAPDTIERGERWWRLLGGFLDLQVKAALLGEWEERYGWPHGQGAHALAYAEELEATLPREVVACALADHPPDARTTCPCGSGRRADRCHLAIVRELIALRQEAREVDDAYWTAYASKVCCGTLKRCRLRGSTPLIYRSRNEYLGSRMGT